MRKLLWTAGAFVAGYIVSQGMTPVRADAPEIPGWVTPGVCYIGPNGTETVYEVYRTWVRTSNVEVSGVQDWRNLAATPTVRQLSQATCAQQRPR